MRENEIYSSSFGCTVTSIFKSNFVVFWTSCGRIFPTRYKVVGLTCSHVIIFSDCHTFIETIAESKFLCSCVYDYHLVSSHLISSHLIASCLVSSLLFPFFFFCSLLFLSHLVSSRLVLSLLFFSLLFVLSFSFISLHAVV